MDSLIRQIVIIVSCLASLASPIKLAWADDMFMDLATEASLLRDYHLISAGGYRTNNASTDNGQSSDISLYQLGISSSIWNNEHNQFLLSAEVRRREFSSPILLSNGFSLPEKIDEASIGLSYKHVTAGDWSLNQSIRFTQSQASNPSQTIEDTVDLVGLAAKSPEPGIVWAFGYLYQESDYLDPVLLPIIEYIYAKHAKWSAALGFPLLIFTYSPHPDWMLGTAGISYKVDELNSLRLTYAMNNWAYHFSDSGVDDVTYTADQVIFDWTHLYFIDHRTFLILDAAIGWEFNRQFEADHKQSIDDATVLGLNLGLSF
jgi:hypothetical protein